MTEKDVSLCRRGKCMEPRVKARTKRLLPILFLLIASIAHAQLVGPGGGSSGGASSTTQGIGGGVTNTPGADSVVNVKNYGAKGNGNIVYDAAQNNVEATGTGATATAPAFTTTSNNDMMLTVYGTNGTFTPPANPTSRVNFSNGIAYNLYIGDQVLASAGTYATTGRTAAQTTSFGWTGFTIPLKPTSSSSAPTFVNATSGSNGAGGTTLSCNIPTGLSNGQVMLAAVANPQFNAAVSTSTPAGWTLYAQANNALGSTSNWMLIYAKVVAGDSGSVTWNLGASVGSSCGIVAYSGVDTTAFFDDPITSASASFTSADLSKLLCVDGSASVLASTTGVDACGTIAEQLNATTIYPTFVNSSGATTSSKELRYSTDDTTAIQAAINAVVSGGEVFFPVGMYGQSAGLTLPTTTINVSLVGTANTRTGVDATFHSNGVTSIACLTKALTSTTPALGITTATTHWTPDLNDVVQNIAFIAGAGQNRDGCGGPGITISNVSTVSLLNDTTIGFNGSGVILKDAGGGGSDAIGLIVIDRLQSHYNGAYGISVPSGSTSVQNISVTNSSVSNNWLDGLNLSNSAFAVSVKNSIFQVNNVSVTAGGANVNFSPTSASGMFGCSFDSNDVEGGNASTAGIRDNTNANGALDGCSITNNRVQGTGSGAIVLGNSSTNTYMNGTVSGNRLFNTGPFLVINGISNAQISNNDCNGVPCVTSFAMTAGGIISSTGGAIPTATCSGGSTGVSIAAGSTNNRGQITTSSSASTNCTITWSAASTWPQAPFCTVTDGAASITPTGVSVGATGTSTMVIDFASATSKVFNWICM